MSRFFSIVLFMFLLNVTINLMEVTGVLNSGLPSTYETIDGSQSKYEPNSFAGLLPSNPYTDMAGFIYKGFGALATSIYDMTLGAQGFYLDFCRMVVPISTEVTYVATFLAVIQNMVIVFCLIEIATGRDFGA